MKHCKIILLVGLLASSASAFAEKIGVSMAYFDQNFLTIIRQSIEKEAQARHVDVQFEDARGDTGRQADQVQSFIASGVDAIIVDEAAKVKVLAKVTTIAPDGDLVPGKDVSMVTIVDKASEETCLEKAKLGPVIVSTGDWTVIPLENLVAQSDRIFAAVGSVEEARLALTILEQGVGRCVV